MARGVRFQVREGRPVLAPFVIITFVASPVVAVGSFVLTIRSPYWTVLGLMALEVLTPSVTGPHTTFTLEKVALVAALLAIAYQLWQDRKSPTPPVLKPFSSSLRAMLIALFVLVCATALTVISAQYLGPVMRETAKAMEYLLLLGVGGYAAQHSNRPPSFPHGFAALMAVVSLTALAEEYTGVHSVFLAGTHLVPRIAGVLEGPNQLAAYLGIGIPILMMFEESATNFWMCSALGIAIIAEFLTFSRGGIITTAIALALLLTQKIGRRTLPTITVALSSAAGLIASYVIAGSGFSHMTGYIDEGATGGVGHRGQLWHAAFFFWRHSPLIGIGAGNFERELALAGVYGVHTHANSLYLQSLAEGGIVLFAATLATVILPLYLLARVRPTTSFTLSTLAAGIGLALHQIVDTLVFYPKLGVLWWLVVGLALGA
jgi:O-antigen ligase